MEDKTENLAFNQRIFALDFLKAISIAAVVYYHSMFFPISTYSQVAIAELILSAPLRFCVPLLLTLSFILFEHKLQKTETVLRLTRKRLNRILIPTIFWFSLAAILQLIKGNSFLKISQAVSLLLRNFIKNIDTLNFNFFELLLIKGISWIFLLAISLKLSILLERCQLASCVR
ncbi:acyltransferase family protein [Spirulina sp. CS-785/01]|uniref:acyltransferase family protein n=1 Tax=Spirulina sp. CS-785/01 TaxID=3021716 RepID=UPI00232B724A|nr:acyltransferase family protein [Spirulina sp. CS-785/01]MDB9315917.1 acyltransferase family protein [Spirulina sp. CS-785/01]